MWKKLALVVGGLVGFLLIVYLIALASMSPMEENEATGVAGNTERQERSWLGDMIHAWKVTRPPDDGVRREGSNEPDSDVSECQWQNLSSDQMVTTHFANHILRYPCTANHDGYWKRHYNQNDELVHEDYRLWVRVLVGPNRNSIWRRSRSEYSDEENIAFKVELSSDGKSIPSNQHEKWIGKAQRIDVAEELGFAVYIGEIFMRAYLKNAMNESGGYPFFSCIASTKQKVKAIFALDQKLGKKVECNGYWNLTDQIQVRILHMNSKLGRDFEFYYSKIDQGLKQTIIEEPPEN